jgi:predicted ferric reductase
MLLTMGALYRIMSPAAAWSMHRAIGSVLLFSVLGHIGALLLDHFINLRPVDVLVPFVSPYQPTPMALGIFGFYTMLLVLATTLYTMTSHAKFWRTVHFFAFPMFILIFIHSLLIGTDAHTWWMRIISWGGLGLILLTLGFRLVWKYRLAPRF